MPNVDLSPNALKYEKQITVGVCFPLSMVAAIDDRATKEMTSRSAWLRRAILSALTAEPASNGR